MGLHRVGHDWSDLAAAVSVYNAGDLGSIPGLGRSPGEGNGNPLQYSCLENSTDRRAWQDIVNGISKRRVLSLGWEGPLEEEMVTHSNILAWKIPWTEESGRLRSIGSQRVGHD